FAKAWEWILFEHGVGGTALGFAERGRERERKARLVLGAEKAGNRQTISMCAQKQPLDTELCVHDAVEPHPERIEGPLADAAVVAHFAHGQLGGRYRDLLVSGSSAAADLE